MGDVMKTVTQLQDEKLALESRLKSITSYSEDGSQYYIDDELAQTIKEQLVFLDISIENLGREMRDMRDDDERKERVIRREKRDTLVSSAKAFYDEKINAYMRLSLWGKAVAMFTGKKPKKLTDREILEVYGRDAADRLIEERIQSILEAKEEQIEILRGAYDESSQEYIYALREIESIYEDKIERTRLGYDEELETAIKSSSSRRGMR